jgi:hypothetical protein
MSLPYSDATFAMAFERECTENLWEGHWLGFGFLGEVPRKITYDNSRENTARGVRKSAPGNGNGIGWVSPSAAGSTATSAWRRGTVLEGARIRCLGFVSRFVSRDAEHGSPRGALGSWVGLSSVLQVRVRQRDSTQVFDT